LPVGDKGIADILHVLGFREEAHMRYRLLYRTASKRQYPFVSASLELEILMDCIEIAPNQPAITGLNSTSEIVHLSPTSITQELQVLAILALISSELFSSSLRSLSRPMVSISQNGKVPAQDDQACDHYFHIFTVLERSDSPSQV